MATANLTANGPQKAFEQLCSTELTAGLHGQLIFISVLNTFLSVIAFLGNALILIALHKESSPYPPSKLLLRSLATTDLCVGLISQPLSVGYWMSEMNEHWNICPHLSRASFVAGYILCGVSAATLTELIKREQTSRPVVGTEIQTSCNCKANVPDRYYHLGDYSGFFRDGILESPDNIMVWYYSYTSISYNLDLLLHEDFPHPPST